MVWTQNMAEVFEHKTPQNLFFMFKGKEYSVGLQFVDESEAQHFTDLIRQLLDSKNSGGIHFQPGEDLLEEHLRSCLHDQARSF